MELHPWHEGPFELIVEAELHRQAGSETDKRLALINFDNAIEVTIGTYLELHPMLRGNRTYARSDVERWLDNYHSRLDFLFSECDRRSISVVVRREYFIHFHDLRGEQYHQGRPAAPYSRDIEYARQAAIWAFAMLFDQDSEEVENQVLERVSISKGTKSDIARSDSIDEVLDETYGLVELAGIVYLTSELLYAADPKAYRELGISLLPQPVPIDGSSRKSGSSHVGNQRSVS